MNKELLFDDAMLFEGVRFDSKGRLSGWLVKNSYGPEKGNNGYLDMKDRSRARVRCLQCI